MTAPLPAVSPGRPAVMCAAVRWYGPRVVLPPLSIEALRGPGAPSRRPG
ncbi:hypothetical protein [Streptomyces cinnamoneus]|nr:hypothetical protein [Streptomyces cinnamoneus]